VERDTGSGFRVLPNLDAVDVLSLNGQTALPQNLYLSFTGSTGGQNNIHELEELEVCAADIRPLTARIHHFELNYAPTALTCSPHAVTIRACMDEACSATYQEPVSATLQPVGGWTAGNPVSFSGGSTIVHLRSNSAGTVQLGVSDSTPQRQSFSQTLCSTANCEVVFADSGFVFDVPNLIAARPESGIALQAVKKDDRTQACVPGFDDGGKRTLQFSSSYVNPDTGTRQVVVNDTPVGASPTDIELTFDSEARASLEVSYDDAGLIDLFARYAPVAGEEKGLVMTGSDQFSSRPYGLCLLTEADQADGSAACESDDLDCPVFQPGGVPVRAGDPFRLLVRPVGWEAHGELLTAEQLCVGNIDTPNFAMGNIALTHELTAPDGVGGELAVNRFDHPLGGQEAVQGQAYTEVGIIKITATPQGSYFGETVDGGESNRIGRFTPAYLGASGSASLQPSCGTFSYQGQPMDFVATGEPSVAVTGYNRAGNPTLNYDRGAFWRLSPPAAPGYVSQTGLASIDPRLGVEGTATIATEGANDGNGSRTYRWSGQRLFYNAAATASNEDLPFQAELDLRFNAAALTDADGVCHGNTGSCQAYEADFNQAPGSEVRLGRLRIDNAHGSELQPLDLPLTIETWQGVDTDGDGLPNKGRFEPETQDVCTSPAHLGTAEFIEHPGNLEDDDTGVESLVLSDGSGTVTLSEPGEDNHGSIGLRFPSMESWLQYGWDGAGRRSATGTATFGVYQGATPLIFRRELYR
jgi:MSHA biogenesis protein MshQ